jgi:hypothetical protein
MSHEYFECQCTCSEHTIRFTYFNPVRRDDGTLSERATLYVNVFLRRPRFLERIWLALKYVFGANPSAYGHFDETLIEPDDADRLINLLQKVKKANSD